MSLDDDVLRELESIRAMVGDHDGFIRQSQNRQLLNRLVSGPEPGRVELGAQPGPRPRFAAGSPTDTLGNTEPYVGQTNLLLDPTFVESWTGTAVLNSGSTGGGSITLSYGSRGDPNNNPFNTGSVIVTFPQGSVYDATLTLTPTTDLAPTLIPVLDYLVAAIRVAAPYGSAAMQSFSTYTLTVEVYDVTTTTVVATTTWDLLTAPANDNHRLVAAYQGAAATFRSDIWRYRLKFHAVCNGTTHAGTFPRIGEPQLHFSWTPDALPFSPQLANWLVHEFDLLLADNALWDVSSSRHGFAPKSPADATRFLNGAATPAFAAVKDSDLAFTDVTSNNAATGQHGFLKKLDNNSAHFMDGTGAWTTPPTVPTKVWKTGKYYSPPYVYPYAAAIYVLQDLIAVPFFVGTSTSFDRIAAVVASGGTASNVVRMGIYQDDGTGRPGALIVDGGTVASTTTGLKTVTISQTLSGLVWLAFVSQVGTTCTPYAHSTTPFLLGDIGIADPNATPNTTGFAQSTVTGALPSPWGSTYNEVAQAPIVWLRKT